jgi:putative NADPH-quinone reductase
MKALGLLAGPRKGRATDRIIDSVLKGIKDKVHEVEKLYLYDLDIKPCSACEACKDTQKCVIEDDQAMILDKMDSADIVVLGSPVYWSNVSSVGKKFIDRMLPFFKMGSTGPIRTESLPSKVVLIATCGMPFPLSHIMGTIPGCLKAMKRPFGRMKAKIKMFYCAGMMDPGTSNPSEKVLKKAYKLGKNM